MPDLLAYSGEPDSEAREKGMNEDASIRRRWDGLIFTSVDDCRVSIGHITDLPFLEGLLVQVRGREGHVSRARVIERRINALRKASISAQGPDSGFSTR